MSDKQKAPPFVAASGGFKPPQESPVQQGWPVEEAPTPEGVQAARDVATYFEQQAEGTVSEAQPSEQSVVTQSEESMAGNADEYWKTGTIGGLSLGNKSGGGGGGRNPFAPAAGNPQNPFQRTDAVKSEKLENIQMFEAVEGTPIWGDVVKFVMVHGKDIQMVRYPNPPRSMGMPPGRGWATVIETTWRGVPVTTWPNCEIQHVKYGWAKWEDCVS